MTDAMLAERVVEWTEKWKQEGKVVGRIEGEGAVLKRLLARRFGPLSPEVLARIDAATLDQLEHWADNILDARSLDEVFCD